MIVYEAIARELQRQRVHATFGLMGEDVAKFIAALSDSGIRYLSSRHESGAVGMADGYARVTGDIGVAIVSRGPGFTNSLTAAISAAKGGSRVLVLAADTAAGFQDEGVAVSAARAPKHVDQATMAGGGGVDYVTLRSPTTAVADLSAVIEQVRSGRTIILGLPTDVFTAEAGDETATTVSDIRSDIAAPDPDAISEVADFLDASWASSHPVILAGRGAVSAQARSALERLGELTGATLATTLLARSFFKGAPYEVGIMGTFATPVATDVFTQADVLLAFGASLNALTTFGGELCSRATIVQFDHDPEAFGRFTDPDVAVIGDVSASAAALVAELERRGHHAVGSRTPELADRIVEARRTDDFRDQSRDGAMDPRALLRAVDQILPEARTLVVDAGHHMSFQATYLSVPDPGSWVWPLDYSAIGSGPAVAIGAALADPGRLTVLGVGDGGLMMTLGELDTAARYGVPLLVLVINDSAYGAEVQFLEADGLLGDLARSEPRSFESIARALGIDAVTVEKEQDLELVADRIRRGLDGPFVVDCKVTTEVRADFINYWHRLTKPRQRELTS